METNLGLNEHHYNTLLSFLRFARYQRTKRLRAVEACFQDIKDTRLQEEVTYTSDEVRELLDELLALVRGDVEAELINCVHTNVVLLRQLFQQAQQWHLRLQADITELENRDILEKVGEFEEQELSGKTVVHTTQLPATKLEPLTDGGQGPVRLLQKEIETLKEQNAKLHTQLQHVEQQTINILEEKSRLKEKLTQAQSELQGIKITQGDGSDENLVENLTQAKMELENDRQKIISTQEILEKDLSFMKQKYTETQSQLELAEMELERKFSQTVAYSNMKKMLTSKNDLIKELRAKLAKYETPE